MKSLFGIAIFVVIYIDHIERIILASFFVNSILSPLLNKIIFAQVFA